jgi:hypothetical protein
LGTSLHPHHDDSGAVSQRRRCIPFNLNGRLIAYALVAGAAGGTALAQNSDFGGNVVYTPANIPIADHTFINLDLNHDGSPDFVFVESVYANGYFGSERVTEGSPRPNGALRRALKQGEVIGRSAGIFSQAELRLAYVNGSCKSGSTCGYCGGGPFLNVTDGYLGVRFQIGGQDHYGWVRLSMSAPNGNITGTITGYAYDTVANEALRAGLPATQLHEKQKTSATLGALAAGADGVPSWRQK